MEQAIDKRPYDIYQPRMVELTDLTKDAIKVTQAVRDTITDGRVFTGISVSQDPKRPNVTKVEIQSLPGGVKINGDIQPGQGIFFE